MYSGIKKSHYVKPPWDDQNIQDSHFSSVDLWGWLRAQNTPEYFGISQSHHLEVYPQQQRLHRAWDCMCEHCAEVKMAEIASFCYCPLCSPKKSSWLFPKEKKKKKRWNAYPCLCSGTANFAVNINCTPTHTYIHTQMHSLVSVP